MRKNTKRILTIVVALIVLVASSLALYNRKQKAIDDILEMNMDQEDLDIVPANPMNIIEEGEGYQLVFKSGLISIDIQDSENDDRYDYEDREAWLATIETTYTGPYLDYMSETYSQNVIIYDYHGMLGKLKELKDKSGYLLHKDLTLKIDGEPVSYEVLTAYNLPKSNKDVTYYYADFDDEEFADYKKDVKKLALYNKDAGFADEDCLMTIVVDNGTNNLIILAKCLDDFDEDDE